MERIYFGNINSERDLGLFTSDVKISNAVPKRYLKSIAGMSGNLDLTHGVSGDEVRFENRTITLEFVRDDYKNEWTKIKRQINNALHGRYYNVSFESDPEWYWRAFCEVTKLEKKDHRIDCIVTMDAYPFVLRDHIYNITSTAEGVTVMCENSRGKVYPTITTSAAITVEMDGESVALSAGTHKNVALRFDKCMNEMLITGAADVTIQYTEESL